MSGKPRGKTRTVGLVAWTVIVIITGTYFTITSVRAHNATQAIFAIVLFGGILIVNYAGMAWRARRKGRTR